MGAAVSLVAMAGLKSRSSLEGMAWHDKLFVHVPWTKSWSCTASQCLAGACFKGALASPPASPQQHYCIAVGVKDSSGLLERFSLPQFAQPQVPQPQSAGLGGGGGMRPPPPRFMK